MDPGPGRRGPPGGRAALTAGGRCSLVHPGSSCRVCSDARIYRRVGGAASMVPYIVCHKTAVFAIDGSEIRAKSGGIPPGEPRCRAARAGLTRGCRQGIQGRFTSFAGYPYAAGSSKVYCRAPLSLARIHHSRGGDNENKSVAGARTTRYSVPRAPPAVLSARPAA